MSFTRRALLALTILPLCLGGCQTNGSFGILPNAKPLRPMRAIWVTRFDYRSKRDVIEIFERCDDLQIDTVMFQVRGNATAFYKSSMEPWAEQLGGKDPGFDPLAIALREAHARGMLLHAWVNVMPAWWGTTPPKDPKQLYNAHPEWMWYDQNGDRQALSDRFYVSVNPCLPEVRRYIVDVLRDLVGRYNVDGLHLDYVRFPNEAPGTPAGSGLDYPRDVETVQRFLGETGKTPEEAPREWDEWRTERVTFLMRDIHNMLGTTRPMIEVSAAVGPEPNKARTEHFQDVTRWIQEGLVDRVFPMNYTSDPVLFRERAEIWEELAPARGVVMGIRVDTSPPEQVREYLRLSRVTFGGFCLFAYQSLYDGPNEALVKQDESARRERSERRAALAPFLRELR
jgi:uncharacterized lipoprotein YddW (UPF0748 family)